MKLRIYGLVLLLGVLAIVVGLVLAQSGGDSAPNVVESVGVNVAQEDVNLSTLYADIPQSRGEDGAFTLGDPNAPITVIEFADFLCGHCQTHHEIIAQFIEEFVVTGKANFQYRFMNVIDQNYSPFMAATAECAYEQDMFWPAQTLLFEMAANQEVGPDLVDVVAERLDLDAEALTACVNEIGTRPFQYEIDQQLGRELGVTGTPATRVQIGDGSIGAIKIGNTVYDSGGAPLAVLQQFIESENPEELFTLVNQLRNDRYLDDDSIITGEPCATPCWNNITVGETAWEDAIAILEADETLGELTINESQDSAAKQAIFGTVDGDPCCQIITMDGETPSVLWLQFAPNNTLAELIAAHGEPTYLIGNRYTQDQAYMTLYFPESLLAVTVFVAGEEEGVISETSEIIGVELLTTESIERILTGAFLHAWEGYQTYSAYMDSEFELIPETES
jgi:protein-disulfide isomerase